RTPSSSLLCARGFLSANPARGLNATSVLTAAASATNAAEAEEITQHLAPGPRALPQSQTKGLCLGSSPLSLSLHRRIWLRPLTPIRRHTAPIALKSLGKHSVALPPGEIGIVGPKWGDETPQTRQK